MRISLTLFFLLTGLLSAQEKYLVYFADKGIATSQSLQKNTQLFYAAIESLSEKSIARRKKKLGEDNFITHYDIPVNKKYINKLNILGVKIIQKLKWFNAVSCYLDESLFKKINRLNFVTKIEKVKKLKIKKDEMRLDNFASTEINNIISDSLDYGPSFAEMELSDIPAVHEFGINGEGVIVGLLDTGFDWQNHPSLQNANVIAEYDFVNNDASTSNEGFTRHGTSVLSLVGGYHEGSIISPAFNSSFLLARTEIDENDIEINIEEDNYVAGLEWLESLGADIISSSVGYSEFDAGEDSYTYSDMDGRTALVTIASEIAFEMGVVTVTSAGNEGKEDWFYITAPADGANIITVGAVNSVSNVASFSSRGPTYDGRTKPEVVAYGVSNFLANSFSGGYRFASGTSFSTPIVAGIIAQLLSVYTHLSNTQVRKIIIESGDSPAHPDNMKGYGLLSAKKAISFPNMKKTNGVYQINKIFFSEFLEGTSPSIFYFIEGDDVVVPNDMTRERLFVHTFDFPIFDDGKIVNLHFEYSDTEGNTIRVPEVGEYMFTYGTDEISLNTDMSNTAFPFAPEEYVLEQNFPNPFNPATTIIYKLPEASNIKIRIYNTLGQLVRTLVNNTISEGEYSVRWGGTDDNGVKVSSGVYIYTMETKEYFTSKKMLLLK